jgi:signal transduction histidine kinase
MPLKNSQDVTSPLYYNIRRLRYILPIAAFVLVLIHQSLAYAWFRQNPGLAHFVWQVVLYGTVGPVVVWFALNWFAQWIRERDEAEAHLDCLYRISRQAATATEMEALIGIALSMPEEIIRPVATSLIWREFPESPWTLAGSRGLQAREEEMLAARLAVAGSDLYCGQCAVLTATSHQNCPLQFHLPQADMLPSDTSVICLPLSTERPPLALLNVYLFGATSLPTHKRRVLESTAAVLSVALDHARLRSREFQMLHRMEQATRQQGGLAATLEHILADMAMAHRAQEAEVFLTARNNGEAGLVCVASWPEQEMQPGHISSAAQALLDEDTIVMTKSGSKEHVVAIPLTAEGQTRGVLVLASRHAFTAAQRAFLQVAASMVALVISNSQLYAKLERQAVLEERNRLAREVHDGLAQSLGFLNFKMQHITRQLDREQWPAVRQGLEEMREALQEIYSEVRLTIQDLRWSLEDEQGLLERLRQYVTDFGERVGLEAHFAVQGQPNLSPRDEVHLFRIVQEALANVQKHARAQKVWVRLSVGPEGTILEVEDDGIGMPADLYPQDAATAGGPEHFGLRIMQERAEAIGGQLSLHSVPGEGTRLKLTVNTAHVLLTPSLSNASESH